MTRNFVLLGLVWLFTVTAAFTCGVVSAVYTLIPVRVSTPVTVAAEPPTATAASHVDGDGLLDTLPHSENACMDLMDRVVLLRNEPFEPEMTRRVIQEVDDLLMACQIQHLGEVRRMGDTIHELHGMLQECTDLLRRCGCGEVPTMPPEETGGPVSI